MKQETPRSDLGTLPALRWREEVKFSVENRPGTGAAAQFLAEHAPFIVELNDGRFAGCPQVGTRVYRDCERGFPTVEAAAAAINQPTDGWTEAPTWVGSVWIRKAD